MLLVVIFGKSAHSCSSVHAQHHWSLCSQVITEHDDIKHLSILHSVNPLSLCWTLDYCTAGRSVVVSFGIYLLDSFFPLNVLTAKFCVLWWNFLFIVMCLPFLSFWVTALLLPWFVSISSVLFILFPLCHLMLLPRHVLVLHLADHGSGSVACLESALETSFSSWYFWTFVFFYFCLWLASLCSFLPWGWESYSGVKWVFSSSIGSLSCSWSAYSSLGNN